MPMRSWWRLPPHVYDVDCIMPNGDPSDWILYRPLEQFADLYLVLSEVRTPQQFLNFVNQYGPLTWADRTTKHFTWADGTKPNSDSQDGLPMFGDPVPGGLATAEMFRDLLNLQKLGDPRRLARHFKSKIARFVGDGLLADDGVAGKVELVSDLERGLRVKVLPSTLRGALWLQLAQKLSGATKVAPCRHCGRWFEAGAGTGRRADAEFCCLDHKKRFHSLERSRRKAGRASR